MEVEVIKRKLFLCFYQFKKIFHHTYNEKGISRSFLLLGSWSNNGGHF